MRRWTRNTFVLTGLLLAAAALLGASRDAVAEEGVRVAILWASLGHGHRSSAEAIQADIARRYPGAFVVTRNAHEFLTPFERRFSEITYDVMTRYAPQVYDWFFRYLLSEGANPRNIADLSAGRSFDANAMLAWLREQRPQIVVSTFNHATEVLIRLRQQGRLPGIQLAWQHTDYVSAPYFVNLSRFIDMTALPHDSLRQYWLRSGVPESRMMTTGMALNPLVRDRLTPELRETFMREHGLDPAVTTISLFGGTAGQGNFAGQARSLAEAIPGPLQIVVLAGRNAEAVRPRFETEPPRPGVRVIVLGMQEQPVLFRFLASSQAVVLKSSGLTPTEVAFLGVPSVLLDINGGQERYNAREFAANGLALVTRDQTEVGALVARILSEPGLRERMRRSQDELRRMTRPELFTDWIVGAARRAPGLVPTVAPPVAPPTVSPPPSLPATTLASAEPVASPSLATPLAAAPPAPEPTPDRGPSPAPPARQVIFVSDIDDTIKLSHMVPFVNADLTFHFVGGRAFAGMAELYQALAANGHSFHYLTATPTLLRPFAVRFLTAQRFPRGPLITRGNLLRRTVAFKVAALVRLMEQNPDARFVFVGDNGEHDPEVFAQVRAHPVVGARIERRYIHHLYDRPINPQGAEGNLPFFSSADFAFALARDGYITEAQTRPVLESVSTALGASGRLLSTAYPHFARVTRDQLAELFDVIRPAEEELRGLWEDVRGRLLIRAPASVVDINPAAACPLTIASRGQERAVGE